MSTTVRVKPSRKNALDLPPPVPLSTFDLLMPPVYVPLYLFFRPSTISSTANQFTALSLISSLADVLEHFPPFAGSIKPDQSGQLYVHSDNRGADFVYEFRNEQLPGEQLEAEDLAPRGSFPDPSDKDEPLLAVKLTSFSCGSHVLVISFSHVLIDLTSAMDFVRSFASQTIGQPLPTVPKRWTRNLFEYFPEAPAISELPGFAILPLGHPPPPPPPAPEPSEQVVLRVPIQELTKLKSSLNISISNFQLLAAVLWRASAAVCSADVEDSQVLYLGIAANGRERSPDKAMAKDHYFGNFVVDVTIGLKKSELLSDGGISSVAAAIQKALKEQLTVEYISAKGKLFQSVSRDRLMPSIGTRLTSWPKDLLDTQDLHFGLVKPGRGKVTITPGENIPFPAGILHVMNASEDVYRVQIAVPQGKGEEVRLREELMALVKS